MQLTHFTITAIDQTAQAIGAEFTFDDTTVSDERLSYAGGQFTVADAATLTGQLRDYAAAWAAGKEQERADAAAQAPSPDVSAMVGQSQSAG